MDRIRRAVVVQASEWNHAWYFIRNIPLKKQEEIWSRFDIILDVTFCQSQERSVVTSYDFRTKLAAWKYTVAFEFSYEVPGFIVFCLHKAGLIEFEDEPEINDG